MGKRERSKAYYEKYHATPKAKAERAARNKARRHHEKLGNVRKGDGQEVDHPDPLSKGGSYSVKNTRVVSRKTNRSYKRDANNRPV